MARILSKEQEKTVMNAIKEAETNTSGEIRIHIEDRCKIGDPIKRELLKCLVNYICMKLNLEME